jgi:MarR family transcriptional regulator, organic hydroperoxide resistance regulator
MEASHMTEEELNTEVMDALVELIRGVSTEGQAIGARYGLNGSDVMALHKIDDPISMKELSQRLGCDPSFITAIADSLERREIVRREPSQRDRRVKNIVLTEQGRTVRDEILREAAARYPWSKALDTNERQCLLGLLRKVVGRVRGGGAVTTTPVPPS